MESSSNTTSNWYTCPDCGVVIQGSVSHACLPALYSGGTITWPPGMSDRELLENIYKLLKKLHFVIFRDEFEPDSDTE